MTKKLPHIQFYTGDWMKDPVLRRCSKAEKGFLIDAICILHENEERGIFAEKGSPWSRREIAYSIGGDPSENLELLESLIEKGALKINEAEAVYSKRMVKDEEIRKKRAASGSKGGNKTQAKIKKKGKKSEKTDTDPKSNKGRAKSEEEVCDYCEEIGQPRSDGLAMWNHWEGNGHKNSGRSMRDWKAVIRSWRDNGYLASQKNGNPFNGTTSKAKPANGKPSLWALKEQLSACENELHAMLHPGGCAHRVALEGDKLEKANRINSRAKELKEKILNFEN